MINYYFICISLLITTVLILVLGSVHRLYLHNKETENMDKSFDEKSQEILELKEELLNLHKEIDNINNSFTPDNNKRWEKYEIWAKTLETFVEEQSCLNSKHIALLDRMSLDIKEILSTIKNLMSRLPYEKT